MFLFVVCFLASLTSTINVIYISIYYTYIYISVHTNIYPLACHCHRIIQVQKPLTVDVSRYITLYQVFFSFFPPLSCTCLRQVSSNLLDLTIVFLNEIPNSEHCIFFIFYIFSTFTLYIEFYLSPFSKNLSLLLKRHVLFR